MGVQDAFLLSGEEPMGPSPEPSRGAGLTSDMDVLVTLSRDGEKPEAAHISELRFHGGWDLDPAVGAVRFK